MKSLIISANCNTVKDKLALLHREIEVISFSKTLIVECVPLATEPGISLIILPLMSILQRNLKPTYLIV